MASVSGMTIPARKIRVGGSSAAPPILGRGRHVPSDRDYGSAYAEEFRGMAAHEARTTKLYDIKTPDKFTLDAFEGYSLTFALPELPISQGRRIFRRLCKA